MKSLFILLAIVSQVNAAEFLDCTVQLNGQTRTFRATLGKFVIDARYKINTIRQGYQSQIDIQFLDADGELLLGLGTLNDDHLIFRSRTESSSILAFWDGDQKFGEYIYATLETTKISLLSCKYSY